MSCRLRLTTQTRIEARDLRAVLHAGFGVFLEKVTDVDREAFEFFVEGLSRAKTEGFAGFRDVAVVLLESLSD